MTALPVAFYLTELSGEAPRRGGRAIGNDASELQIAEARQRGLLEGRAAAQEEHEAAAAAQAAGFAEKLESERQKWVAEQGAHLGSLIAFAIEDLERRISDLVAEVLKPVLTDQVRVKAVEELSQSLNGLLSKGEYARITVSGPSDLLALMEERVSGGPPGVSFVPADATDIIVSADETILATRISAWADAIGGVNP